LLALHFNGSPGLYGILDALELVSLRFREETEHGRLAFWRDGA